MSYFLIINNIYIIIAKGPTRDESQQNGIYTHLKIAIYIRNYWDQMSKRGALRIRLKSIEMHCAVCAKGKSHKRAHQPTNQPTIRNQSLSFTFCAAPRERLVCVWAERECWARVACFAAIVCWHDYLPRAALGATFLFAHAVCVPQRAFCSFSLSH